MKKLMIGFVGALAMVAGAEVESGNTVGVTGKSAAENLNWYVQQFFTIGCNTSDINAIQLNDNGQGLVGWGDSMQIVGPLGNPAANYSYWDASMHPSGTATLNYWQDDITMEPAEVSFDAAEGIAIDNMNEYEFDILNNGDVSFDDVVFTARPDLNWSGNPFPAEIDINDIQLDDEGQGLVGWGDSMQIVGPLGNPAANYSYWDASMHPSGTATSNYWQDDITMEPADFKFKPGDGFAIDNMNGLEFKIKIACPYKK